ncbi:PREDICTED: probable folate-biopterin transporter 3 [Tarenaya hassleriana]|uniref:probable folate-biopterin transporter 3 n=1 Tax=Tarenaya hassleriana TaxID=28532 RepID=UPI00053C5DF9|nr:PREDICTED: probable folate-biopterin transporter 3 [Tarenaya hassleriana]
METSPRQHDDVSRRTHQQKQEGLLDLILRRPVRWLRMLIDELHWSFFLGVIIVYGVSQGLGHGLSKVSTQYYLKDEQKVQPSEAQVYVGVIQIPWIVKPIWGLFTDVVPVLGYRRRPYFIFAGLLAMISMLVLSLHRNLDLALALSSLVAGSAGVAVADVTIDACVTQCSISNPSLASDMQSLCGISSSVGSLVGLSLSGLLVHLFGPKGVYGLLSLTAGLVVMAGMLLNESPSRSLGRKRVNEKFMEAGKSIWKTFQYGEVWRPCLFLFLSAALSLHIHEGMFYWYTDSKDGPLFSKEAVGSILSFGAVGSLVGILLYQNFLKNFPFRNVIFWALSLSVLSGLLDLVLVLRVNLKMGIPDYFFIVIDEVVSRMISRIKWLPLLVLSSKLCPSGMEGTFFALLMSIDHVGHFISSWGGGILLHGLKVTRTEFDNLWLAIVIRSLLRLIPIGLVFLIPNSDPNSFVLPTEMLKNRTGEAVLESDNVEMSALLGAEA